MLFSHVPPPLQITTRAPAWQCKGVKRARLVSAGAPAGRRKQAHRRERPLTGLNKKGARLTAQAAVFLGGGEAPWVSHAQMAKSEVFAAPRKVRGLANPVHKGRRVASGQR